MSALGSRPEGPLLLFDTSTSMGSVGVAVGGEIRAQRELPNPREQAAELLPAIAACLGDAGLGPGELSGVVVGAGPGSFTGVRVAAATAKGLVAALGCPLWPVPSLCAAAASAGWGAADQPERRVVLFDARGDRVYRGTYLVSADAIIAVNPDVAGVVGDLLAEPPEGARVAGDALEAHGQLLRAAGFVVVAPPAGQPDARGLLRALHLDPTLRPTENPAQWEPLYLRESSAVRARK